MVIKFHRNTQSDKDFRGQDLSGENFSFRDICGANFANAILVNTNFSNVKAGLSVTWKIKLIIVTIIISLLGGLIAGYSGTLISDIWIGNSGNFLFGILAIVSYGILLAIFLLKGLGGLLAISAGFIAACLIAMIAFLPNDQSNLAVHAQFIALTVVGSFTATILIAIGIAINRLVALWQPKPLTIFIATLGTIYGIVLGAYQELDFVISFPVALSSILAGAWAGWLAIDGSKKYHPISSIATALVTKGGTNFRGANLTDADFTQADLPSTDFRRATLTRTNWFQAQHIEQGQVEGYLADPKIRQLVVTKDGQAQNFDRCNLRGINLRDAKLIGASFIGADLSEANLENADLSKAKLVQAQLYKTNLNGVCLTGACIQDWAISTDTIVEAVRCEYIYMRLPTDDNPEPWRKPDNRQEVFKEGDFADFISPIIKTLNLYNQQNVDPRQVAHSLKSLDLYHYQGIDPSAAFIVINELAEKNPQAGLEIIALEGRGNEKIRLQAVVNVEADSSQLSAEYSERYRTISALPSKDIKALLATAVEKDERIRSLEQMLMSAIIESRKFYVEINNQQGDSMSEKSSININTSGSGNISGLTAGDISGVVNLGEISGNVTNTINKLPDTSGTNEPSLKELLLQLQAAIQDELELEPEDKAEALEQVKVIAEAGQQPEDNILQKSAKTSMKILKGTIASLPDAAKLADAGAKLLPLIVSLL
jgi:uncharacterized protein YjbI with pentapeptide repeats